MQLRRRLIALGAVGAVLSAAAFLGPIESGPKGPQLEVYHDIGGVPTWCYGQTVGQPKARYTTQECDQDLLRAVSTYHAGVMRFVPPEAPHSVQAAMTSVAYHTGVGGWAWSRTGVPSPFRAPLAAHDWEATCAAIIAPWEGRHGVALGYKATVNGKPVRGLENRRRAEYRLCVEDLR